MNKEPGPSGDDITLKPDVTRKLVLLVEDDLQLAGLLQKLLERAGLAVTVAHDGLEGLQLARTKSPDVIVLDGELPVLNGYEMCRQLKAEPTTSHIPILFCSGSYDARTRAQAAGADEFLAKPDDLLLLVQRLTPWLRR